MTILEPYIYKDLPITPVIIETLILKLANGKTLKRDDLVKLILEYHITNGGAKPEAQDFPRSVKKALTRLQEKGIANNKSYGFWSIESPTSSTNVTIEEPIEDRSKTEIESLPAHVSYGNGPNSVYCYYFPAYKELNLARGKTSWPCKIGRTDRDPLLRVLAQSTTALPEIPFIEFVIQTQNSNLLEVSIHTVLTLRGRHIENSPGTEWFDTNPDEILEIVRFIDSNILDRIPTHTN